VDLEFADGERRPEDTDTLPGDCKTPLSKFNLDSFQHNQRFHMYKKKHTHRDMPTQKNTIQHIAPARYWKEESEYGTKLATDREYIGPKTVPHKKMHANVRR
jgi:hypothetical protein